MPGDKIVNSINTNDTIHVLSSIKSDKSSAQTIILNKNDGAVEINYNRGQFNSTFTIPGRSIVTAVDSLG